MLKIENLHAEIDGKPILKGLSLAVNAGEVHAIMGPNGAGKSTLGYVLGGRPGYEATEGSVSFDGEDLLEMAPHERAAAGLFLGFQYPVEIPGVSNVQFLREALNSQRRGRGGPGKAGRGPPPPPPAPGGAPRGSVGTLERGGGGGVFGGGEEKKEERGEWGGG